MLAVDVKNIKKTFISKQDTVEAVKDVSFQVKQEIGRASCRERV